MARIKLTLEYDGTHYVGWQLQENGPSVQGRLQRAVAELVGESVSVVAAGRTDSGVHAWGQVAAFDSPRALPLKAYWMGLNGLLPEDIAVVKAEEVVDYTQRINFAERLAKRFGSAVGVGAVQALRTSPPLR